MAKQDLNKIFLSASIPYHDRDKKFYNTADIIAIRDAVRALATVVIPKAHLVWGGHPSITPLIRFVTERMKVDIKKHVTLYQSRYFEERFPVDNFAFEKIRLTEKAKGLKESIEIMRNSMFEENDFRVGIFIGGMEGILDEYEMLIKKYPNVKILPIASTGGAARILFNRIKPQPDIKLVNDYAYMALFKDLLSEYI